MATINRQSITTSASQEDIFLLSKAGFRFINRGNLSAMGTQSSPIDITADDVTVQNFGSLTVDGLNSPVILVGHRDAPVDGVSIYNFGSILNNGDFADLNGNGEIDVDEYFADGIAYYGTNGLVENRGTITTLEGAGIGTLAADTTILNAGEIHSSIVGIMIDSFGGGHDRNTIINEGLISVSRGTFGVGIRVLSNDNIVINEGEIVAEGDESIGILLQGSGNRAENEGTIIAIGEHSTAVYLYGGGHTFTNEGTISVSLSSFSAAVRFDAEQPAGLDMGTFVNNGTVLGSVLGTDGNETIINYGLLGGDVRLGGGDDTYVAGKNSVNGPTALGTGADTLVLEKGFGGFSVGGFLLTEGDVIDVSGLGISSFEEVMSYARQDPATRLIIFDFGGGSVVALNGEGFATSLSDFTPANFIFDGAGAATLTPSSMLEDYMVSESLL